MTAQRINLTVAVDMPIKLAPHEKFEFFVGPGMHLVTVKGDGTIELKSNGGGGATVTINADNILNHLKNFTVEDVSWREGTVRSDGRS